MRRSILFALLLAATLAPAQNTKRPMTFEDMMHMKRLGSTAVSPDGKWLGYSVTTVDLEKNTKTSELFIQPIAGGDAKPLTAGQPGDDGIQFSADGKRILFISSRAGAPQIWLAAFDSATGATTNARKLTNLDLGIDNAKWSPDSKFIVFTASVYPDCPAIVPNDNGAGAECNYERDAALAASKVKAQIFTHLLYRHWNHFTGDKRSHLFQVSVENGGCPRSHPQRPPRRPALLARRRRRIRHLSRLERTGLHREPRPRARHQHQRRHLHPRPHQPRSQARQGQHIPRRRLQPRLLARRKISSLAQPAPPRLRKRQVPPPPLRPSREDDQGPAAEVRQLGG